MLHLPSKFDHLKTVYLKHILGKTLKRQKKVKFNNFTHLHQKLPHTADFYEHSSVQQDNNSVQTVMWLCIDGAGVRQRK